MTRWQWFTRAGPRPIWLRYLLLIALASGLTRFALGTQWMRESAVLYVLIPYLVGILIYFVVPVACGDGFWARFGNHMRFETRAMDMVPLETGLTRVTITVGYDRKLAPSWYFGPLQKKAVSDGLAYALSDILDPVP